MMRAWRLLLVSSLTIAALCPWPTAAQVNRCATDSGATVYTDRPCSAIGASARLPRGAAASGTGARRVGCARNLQDLIYEITSSVDRRDVNQLGAVYHWVGMSPAGGNRVLDRLQAIVDRPLMDIVPIRAAAAPRRPPIDMPSGDADAAPASPMPREPPASPGEDAAPAPPPRRSGGPVGLRLEQTLRNSATPSRTVLGLRRHLDCWWVVLPGA